MFFYPYIVVFYPYIVVSLYCCFLSLHCCCVLTLLLYLYIVVVSWHCCCVLTLLFSTLHCVFLSLHCCFLSLHCCFFILKLLFLSLQRWLERTPGLRRHDFRFWQAFEIAVGRWLDETIYQPYIVMQSSLYINLTNLIVFFICFIYIFETLMTVI